MKLNIKKPALNQGRLTNLVWGFIMDLQLFLN